MPPPTTYQRWPWAAESRPWRAVGIGGSAVQWAAAAETLDDTKTYREQLRQVHPEAVTEVVDALVLEAEGNVDAALGILRDADDPDAHAAVFTTLVRNGGSDAALAWFDEQLGRDDPNFLTGVGWSNVAVALAEAGRWDDAVGYLAASQAKVDEWPDLAFVGGVMNAAMLLPAEIRALALQMNLFHPGINTLEGPDAQRYRACSDACFARASRLLAEIDLGERARGAEDWSASAPRWPPRRAPFGPSRRRIC